MPPVSIHVHSSTGSYHPLPTSKTNNTMRLPTTKSLDELIQELTALREALGGDTPCYFFDRETACNKPVILHVTQEFYTEDGGEELAHPFVDFTYHPD